MAAHINWLPRIFGESTKTASQKKTRSRPLPLRLRTYSVTGFYSPGFDENRDGVHPRNKSISIAADVAELSPPLEDKSAEREEAELAEVDSARTSVDGSAAGISDVSSLTGSPKTQLTSVPSERSSLDVEPPETIHFDFSKINYELERAKVLGEGLWSTVYMAEQKRSQSQQLAVPTCSPPKTTRFSQRSRIGSTPSLFAVKMPSRQDSKDILQQEARVLSHLQRRSTSSQHIVPFFGLDTRNDSLIFEAVIGGSLENLNGRLKQMTEVARHLELINIFPGIAYDLINGLEFLHANGVVHADIKPGNILLDISEHATQQQPVVRARYIDFSAAFIPSKGDSASNAGGTWDYMAPEQMRIQKELNTPTFASDVWSLGITLLYILVGDSPYVAACGGNLFMLREAIKTGDPLQFARMDSVPRKRLAACQDFVDICRQALKKNRDNRATAVGWVTFMLEEFGS